MDARLVAAVLDNARWCDRVAVSHGLPTRFDADAWVSSRRTPDGYPDAVTLRPDAAPEAVLGRIDDSVGSSVKDSFATLDLAPAGFEVLFTGTWFGRPPGGRAMTAGDGWEQVTTTSGLSAWAAAHGGGSTFRAALLDDPTVLILARRDGAGRLVAGVVGTLADAAVGISNGFCVEAQLDGDAFAAAAAAVAERAPGRFLVGYLADDRLAVAIAAGFEPIGPLRVWLRPH